MKRLLLLLYAITALAPTSRAEPQLLNGVAVIVNDTIITFKEVFTAMADDEAFLERRFAFQPQVLEQKRKELMQQRIEDLVERRLVLDEFKRAGYNLTDSVIESRINNDIRSYGNRMTLMKTLQARGLTFENYKTKTRERFIIEAMSEHNVPRDPVVSPNRIEAYYNANKEKFQLPDQVKLRMISLTNRPNDSAYSPKKLAEEIIAKLKEGAPFPEMAKLYSQDPQAAKGGELGWVDRKFLREELSEKAFALKKDEHSAPINLGGSCYILLAEDKRTSHIRPVTEVREEIEDTLKNEEMKRRHEKWIARLKQKSFVRYF